MLSSYICSPFLFFCRYFLSHAHLCNHNKFPLSCKIQYGGGPTLSHDDCCQDCIIGVARSVVSADTYRDRRESMKQLARDILDGNCPDGKYYISRLWYDCMSFHPFSAPHRKRRGHQISYLLLVMDIVNVLVGLFLKKCITCYHQFNFFIFFILHYAIIMVFKLQD